jgi:hypothetical protein
MEYLKLKGGLSSKGADDGEITTTQTQNGDELEQMQEMLREKDSVIDMLSKEKNYYVKKTDLLAKQFAQ